MRNMIEMCYAPFRTDFVENVTHIFHIQRWDRNMYFLLCSPATSDNRFSKTLMCWTQTECLCASVEGQIPWSIMKYLWHSERHSQRQLVVFEITAQLAYSFVFREEKWTYSTNALDRNRHSGINERSSFHRKNFIYPFKMLSEGWDLA